MQAGRAAHEWRPCLSDLAGWLFCQSAAARGGILTMHARMHACMVLLINGGALSLLTEGPWTCPAPVPRKH